MQGTVSINLDYKEMDFAFDKAFDAAVEQLQVFEAVQHVAASILDGFNSTLLAYGQVTTYTER